MFNKKIIPQQITYILIVTLYLVSYASELKTYKYERDISSFIIIGEGEVKVVGAPSLGAKLDYELSSSECKHDISVQGAVLRIENQKIKLDVRQITPLLCRS